MLLILFSIVRYVLFTGYESDIAKTYLRNTIAGLVNGL